MRSPTAHIAAWLVHHGASEEEYEVLRYGIACMLGNAVMYLAIIGIGICCGSLVSSICWLSFLLPLRKASGGMHARSRLECFIISVSLGTASILAAPYVATLSFFPVPAVTACILFTFMYAPIMHAHHPLPEEYVQRNRRNARAIVLVESLVVIAVWFWMQTRTAAACGLLGMLCGTCSLVGAHIQNKHLPAKSTTKD